MQSRCKLKRFWALLLTVLMVLACMPMTVMAEEPTVPDDGVSIEVIPDESGSEPIEEPAHDVLDTEPEEQEQVEKIPMEEEPPTDPAAEAETPEEPAGLPEETIYACDYRVMIPMHNGVDSLNVAAASAVSFWELLK